MSSSRVLSPGDVSGKEEEGVSSSLPSTTPSLTSSPSTAPLSSSSSSTDLNNKESKGEVEMEQGFDVRVAMIGNVDSGKSTLVGVLTKCMLDDGRGSARSRVFNFVHEQQNGRTSSIAHEIMGFSAEGEQVVPADRDRHERHHNKAEGAGPTHSTVSAQSRNATWHQIVEKSEHIITFLDLCGHEKYLKTTIFGLIGCFPDYAMIVVGANMGIQRMTREHLGIALALHVPVFIVVTKIDIAPQSVFKESIGQLTKLLKSNAARKLPLVIREDHDVEVASNCMAVDRICPIFCVSSVTGEGLERLRKFLSRLSNRIQDSTLYGSMSDPSEFHIDGVYHVTGVGVVVAGTAKSGTITCNQQMLLGPDTTGAFRPVLIRSIHSRRVPTDRVVAGQAASFSLRSLVKKEPLKRSFFRKGMVLVDRNATPSATWEFEAEVVILHHATTIKEKYQAVVHCGVIRQAAMVKSLSCNLLRTGDKGTIQFRFMYHAEFLTVGMPLLFREGRTKGLGKVVKLLHP